MSFFIDYIIHYIDYILNKNIHFFDYFFHNIVEFINLYEYHIYRVIMAISDKIKALLKLQGKNNKGLADFLRISDQALSNKFYRDSYSGEDLIKIAEYLECEIAFIAETTKIPLTAGDIKKA